MSRKNKIIISIVGISIISLALIGLTYGYYLTRIQGNTNNKSISISTANLELTYSDNSDVITGTNIVPGTTLGTKTFTVTNNGDNNVDSYSVGLVNVINTFTRLDDIKYTVTCSSSVTGKTCNGVSESTFPNENSYIIENQIDSKEVQTYVIEVEYKEMNVDQSIDMGKTLEAKIDIFDTKALTIQGTVTNSSENDYVVINSKEQTSEIVDGKYKFVGIEPDTHKITIKNRKTSKNLNTDLVIKKGESQSIEDDVITIDDTSRIAEININVTDNSITKTISGVSDGLSKKYKLYIPITASLGDMHLSDCINNSSICSGPYIVRINKDMTINDWLKSEYINELKSNQKILTGLDAKNKINSTSSYKESCSKNLSLIDDDMLYYYTHTTMFENIGYIALREYSPDVEYLDQLSTKVAYPDDTTILNEIFDNNILFLIGNGSQICYLDTD